MAASSQNHPPFFANSRQSEHKEFSAPLHNARDLDPLLERIGDAHYVLLGEASHGTHEYYSWRTAISKRLIQEKGFSLIAVEGDWPACYSINRYIKNYPTSGSSSVEVLSAFQRWPTWMWANWEIVALMDWLKDYNRSAQNKVGFYGLDVYSLWESMQALVEYLEKQDKKAAQLAREAIKCFQPYGEEGIGYAQATASIVPASCQQEVLELLQEVRSKAFNYDHEPEAPLNAEMNAWVAVNAERYYKSMTSFRADSWNIRDTHMVDTLNRLMDFYGQEAKVIVWEHNTHIGDARYTDMKRRGNINVGQLVREQQKEKDVVLVGFGSYKGSVIAGEAWGSAMQKMFVPEAMEGSVEAILHQESAENKLLIFNPSHPQERFNQIFPHRAIGVVYDPELEQFGNYVPSVLARRYDAFLYLDQTTALHPLHMQGNMHQIPDTFPFAV